MFLTKPAIFGPRSSDRLAPEALTAEKAPNAVDGRGGRAKASSPVSSATAPSDSAERRSADARRGVPRSIRPATARDLLGAHRR
jgi:hypothetical protein